MLDQRLATIHKDNLGVYGARKMWKTHNRLRPKDPAARCTIERRMRALGLAGVSNTRTTRTIRRAPAGDDRPEDRLGRDFTAAAPNQRWTADITYVATWAGFRSRSVRFRYAANTRLRESAMWWAYNVRSAAHRVGVRRQQRVDEALQQLTQQIRAGLGQVLVQELGGVDTGASGHRCASLRVGCRRFLEESRGDRAHVYARAVTTSYTTLLDSTGGAPPWLRHSDVRP